MQTSKAKLWPDFPESPSVDSPFLIRLKFVYHPCYTTLVLVPLTCPHKYSPGLLPPISAQKIQRFSSKDGNQSKEFPNLDSASLCALIS